MEHFVVSARKYRPQDFENIVGQEAITNTLEKAIENNHLAQALLFTGPRGVGKTSCARILAKRINQQSESESKDFEFNVFELDAASNNSVDDIRNLTEQVRILPQVGKYKVYIIDEVHMLSTQAFNAFLKTLEEPPPHAVFILATTEKHKIIPTILSRCQIFDFNRIGVLDIKKYLKKICEKENITAEDGALHIIAQKADGAMRDALSIFDRIVSFSGSNLTIKDVAKNLNFLDYETYFNITSLLLENNIPKTLNTLNEILSNGFDGSHFINGLASHFRDLLVAKDSSTIGLLEVSDSVKNKYKEQSSKADISFLMKSIDKANNCDLNYKASKNKRLLVELTLMQIASITFDSEKKKSDSFIIPATLYKESSQNSQKEKPIVSEKPKSYKPKKADNNRLEKTTSKTEEKQLSRFSLKSVRQNNQAKKKLEKKSFDDSHRDNFTEKDLQLYWKKYIDILEEKGEKSTASILDSDIPKLHKDFKIVFFAFNNVMEEQIIKELPALLGYLKKELNNYYILIDVVLNEKLEKKFIYTPEEKYKRLKEKNPNIEKLRQTFELDL